MAAEQSILNTPTHWGAPSPYVLTRHSRGSEHLAVLFPGQNYPVVAPLLYYAGKAAFEAGCDVLSIEYGYVTNHRPYSMAELAALVNEVSAGISSVLSDHYSRVVFIGKSLGTAVAAEVATLSPTPVRNHIFLTPLRRTIPFLQDADHALVIVGDRDPLFGGDDILQLADIPGLHVSVVDGADHALYIEGDHMRSLHALTDLTAQCARFCAAMH